MVLVRREPTGIVTPEKGGKSATVKNFNAAKLAQQKYVQVVSQTFFTTVGTSRLPFCGFADGANRYNKTIKSTSHHTAFSTGSLRNAISVKKKKKILGNSIQKESLGTALNEEDRANCGT